MKSSFSARRLCFSAALIALAFVTSLIKLIDMPMGGSVTLCSMLFICIIGYFYGPKIGLAGSVAYGILQFITNPYFVTIPQVLCDYLFAFGVLGISGFFWKKKYGLLKGYIFGAFGRFVFSFLSGWIFFGTYAPETMGAPLYSFLYNGAYLGAEIAITIVIILLPPVRKAIDRIKLQA